LCVTESIPGWVGDHTPDGPKVGRVAATSR
jgi:hypothetical protein